MADLLLNRPWLMVAVLVLGIALGAWLGSRVRRFWMRRQLARRWSRARRGEESPFTVRADYLVERQGVRAVVEVKTGAVADPSSRGTRRQILEYAWVYGVTEVYLFDADAQRLHSIGVPTMAGGAVPAPWMVRPVIVAFAIGVVFGALAIWWLMR